MVQWGMADVLEFPQPSPAVSTSVSPSTSTPMSDVIMGNRLVAKEKLETAMMVLGRNPQITRDGRVEGIDYNVPLESRKCATPTCQNVRKLKGRKDNGTRRRVYFKWCQKCLLKSKSKKAKYLSKKVTPVVQTGR